jgi:hypothetical protein
LRACIHAKRFRRNCFGESKCEEMFDVIDWSRWAPRGDGLRRSCENRTPAWAWHISSSMLSTYRLRQPRREQLCTPQHAAVGFAYVLRDAVRCKAFEFVLLHTTTRPLASGGALHRCSTTRRATSETVTTAMRSFRSADGVPSRSADLSLHADQNGPFNGGAPPARLARFAHRAQAYRSSLQWRRRPRRRQRLEGRPASL